MGLPPGDPSARDEGHGSARHNVGGMLDLLLCEPAGFARLYVARGQAKSAVATSETPDCS